MNMKIGEVVKLKKGLIIGQRYGGIKLLSDMPFKGKSKINRVDEKYNVYSIEKKPYWYSEEMLEHE